MHLAITLRTKCIVFIPLPFLEFHASVLSRDTAHHCSRLRAIRARLGKSLGRHALRAEVATAPTKMPV